MKTLKDRVEVYTIEEVCQKLGLNNYDISILTLHGTDLHVHYNTLRVDHEDV